MKKSYVIYKNKIWRISKEGYNSLSEVVAYKLKRKGEKELAAKTEVQQLTGNYEFYLDEEGKKQIAVKLKKADAEFDIEDVENCELDPHNLVINEEKVCEMSVGNKTYECFFVRPIPCMINGKKIFARSIELPLGILRVRDGETREDESSSSADKGIPIEYLVWRI